MMAHAEPIVDPITVSVIRGMLESTQREMTFSLEKTARSSVFNLAHDYSAAIFNYVPEMVLQGDDIPIHLGPLMPAMKAVARYFGADIHPGDLIVHNDPTYGGSHKADVYRSRCIRGPCSARTRSPAVLSEKMPQSPVRRTCARHRRHHFLSRVISAQFSVNPLDY